MTAMHPSSRRPSPGTASTPNCAQRIALLPASPLRALLKSAQSDLWLDLAGGIPDPELFPLREFQQAAERVLSRPTCLQYAPTEGLLALREQIAIRLRSRGARVTPEDILITQGAQHALSCAAQLLCDEHRPVALEHPVYPGAAQAFALAGAPVVPLSVTEDGWNLDVEVPNSLAALYCIPCFQNPTGRLASTSARHALLEFAAAHRAWIVEDDAYGELSFQGKQVPLLADAPERVVHLGSFSKVLAPGLRLGYAIVPPPLRSAFIRVLQASALQPGTLAQQLTHEVSSLIDLSAHTRRLIETYGPRAAALRDVVRRAGYHAAEPKGGFFLWLETRGSGDEVCRRLLERGVAAAPASAFGASQGTPESAHVRLSFSRFSVNSGAADALVGHLKEARVGLGILAPEQ